MKRSIGGCSTRRRGVTLVFTMVMMVVLLGFATLAIDSGQIFGLRAETQATADAGALAGATMIVDEQTTESVYATAMSTVAINQRGYGYESLGDQLVEIGVWNSVTHTFTSLDPGEWESGGFAVRVRAAHNNAPLFFAAIYGKYKTDVARAAVAVGSRPCGGIWGLEGVRALGGVFTDSYDSTEGAYSDLSAGDNGDICSGQGIDVTGSAEINGDVMAGYGYEFKIAGQAATITGLTTSSLTATPTVDVDLGDSENFNNNDTIGLTDEGRDPFIGGWNMSIRAQDNLTIAPGTYYLDSLRLKADASLTVTGPTTIYVAGDVDATGSGITNTTQDPNNLTLIVLGSSVKLNGSGTFYGTVIAPYADVVLGGSANFYGALIGKTVVMHGDFQFHVDESSPILAMIESPPATLVK